MKEILLKHKSIYLLFGIVILIFSIGFAQIRRATLDMEVKNLPTGNLTLAPRENTGSEELMEELNMCIRCAGTDYALWIPMDADFQNDYVRSKTGDVEILVMVSDIDMETFFQDTMIQSLYFSVLGYKPKTDIAYRESGYMGRKLAEYATGISRVKISVRNATFYNFAYGIHVSDDCIIYVATVCSDKKQISYAKEVLDNICRSAKRFGEVEEPVRDAMLESFVQENNDSVELAADFTNSDEISEIKEDITSNDLLSINLTYKMETDIEDGYFVVMWENYMIRPESLSFLSDYEEFPLVSEQSADGFYVFRLTNAKKGDYILTGTTKKPLKDVYMECYTRDDYDNIFSE